MASVLEADPDSLERHQRALDMFREGQFEEADALLRQLTVDMRQPYELEDRPLARHLHVARLWRDISLVSLRWHVEDPSVPIDQTLADRSRALTNRLRHKVPSSEHATLLSEHGISRITQGRIGIYRGFEHDDRVLACNGVVMLQEGNGEVQAGDNPYYKAKAAAELARVEAALGHRPTALHWAVETGKRAIRGAIEKPSEAELMAGVALRASRVALGSKRAARTSILERP
jgi:hypothetical protein